MTETKAVEYKQPFFVRRPLTSTLDTLGLLRRSGVDFIPLGNGKTLRTSPLFENNSISWKEAYVKAAMIYLTNPLCFAATSLICDELADGRTVVEEKVGSKWKEHIDNPLADWIGHPNQTMDIKEWRRAWGTHFHTFGGVYVFMFQKGDILPNGKINQRDNNFDFIFPGRIAENTESNPYGFDWWYLPIGYEEPLKLNSKSLYCDVIYNPVGHSVGNALPTNPLNQVFDIHTIYLSQIKKFFTGGAMPTHLLTRIIDLQKDASSVNIQDSEIDEAIGRVYNQVGRGGERESGWLGLRGDWRVNRIGSALPELMNPDLLQYLESLVSAVYKVPPSIFWAGMQSSNQRASRQQDSIDFYNQKIKPMNERIDSRISDFLVPKFIKGTKAQFRISTDTSEMALAQYANTKQYRMYERWYQLRLINRGQMLEFVNEPTDHLTTEEYDEWYSGSNDSQGMNVGAGAQSVEEDNGLE